jgi:hypothetical protein
MRISVPAPAQALGPVATILVCTYAEYMWALDIPSGLECTYDISVTVVPRRSSRM